MATELYSQLITIQTRCEARLEEIAFQYVLKIRDGDMHIFTPAEVEKVHKRR